MKRNSNLRTEIDQENMPIPEKSFFCSKLRRNLKEKPRRRMSMMKNYINQNSNEFDHKYSCIDLSDDIFVDIKNLLEYYMQFEFLNQDFLAKSSDKTVLYPELNLFIWSLLLNRIELAKYFWRIGSVGV